MTRANYAFRPILVSYTAEAKANNPIRFQRIKPHRQHEGTRGSRRRALIVACEVVLIEYPRQEHALLSDETTHTVRWGL